MATNAPSTCCIICGTPHEYEVEARHRLPGEPVVFGPTHWRQKSHRCPPGAIEKFRTEMGLDGSREPDFTEPLKKEKPMTAMRAKMKINHIDKRNEGTETLYFNPVAASKYPEDGSDENNTYAKWSPSGMLSLTVCNPALLGKFAQGEEYYLDFHKAG